MNALLVAMVAILLIAASYLLQLAFANLLKKLAEKQILCTYLKENRIIQIDDGTKFNQFVLSKRGYSFAFQAESNKDDWDHERDRWKIVENKHFNLEDELSGFQKWCMNELGIYWFGGLLFGKKIRAREVDLYTYDKKTNQIKKIEPKSQYLFATDTVYAWEIRNAEDVTGNSFKISFGVTACVTNPYIAWIENERWDDTFATKAMAAPIPLIKNLPFHVLTPIIKKKMDDSKDKEKIDHDEIAEQFKNKVKQELDNIHIGLEFKSVDLFNIDPENPDLFKSILDLYEAGFQAEANIEKKRGEAEGLELVNEAVRNNTDKTLKIERDDLGLRLAAMENHLEAAKLVALQKTFGNVTVLGGSDALNILINPEKTKKDESEKKA